MELNEKVAELNKVYAEQDALIGECSPNIKIEQSHSWQQAIYLLNPPQ